MSSENASVNRPITFPDVVDMIGHASYSNQAAEHSVNSADVKAGFWNCCEANPGPEAVGFTAEDGVTLVWHRACKADASTVPAHRRATIVTEADMSGVEILADMLTLSPVAEVSAVRTPDQVARFHRLSAPMIGVLTEVARSRGLVGAWAMRNVVVPGVDRATMRTVAALRSRGLIDAQTNDGDQSGTGGLMDYVLTEAGYSVAEAIGCPVVELPTEAEAITAVVDAHTEADCATGCEVTISRGVAVLPAGGDVCLGCGSIFTRPNGQLHPALTEISLAVVARNQTKGN